MKQSHHAFTERLPVTIACTLPKRNKAAQIAGPHKFALNNGHMESWARGRAEGVAAGYKQGWDAAQKAGSMDHETAWDEGYREGRQAGYDKGLDEGREEQKQQLINHRVNGLADALVFMLMSRFGEISVDIADRIYGALEEELYIWLAAVPQANTLQEVLACRPHEDMMVLQLLRKHPA